MCAFDVSSGLSEMSPEPPERTAYTGRGFAPGYPELKYSRPFLANGDGAVRKVIPESSHSSLPSRSYDRTLPLADTTSSVRRSFSQMYGVDQVAPFVFSSRFIVHTGSPVFASNAAMKES